MKWFLLLLSFINFLGFLTFPVFYGHQMLLTNPFLWFFVPDCQLSALFFAVALLLIVVNHESFFINLLAFTSGLKYGFWTLFVMFSQMSFYLSPVNAVDYWFIIIAHVVLMIQPLILFNHLRLSGKSFIVFALILLNDFSDYVLGTHPLLPSSFTPVMAVVTPLISFFIILSLIIRRLML